MRCAWFGASVFLCEGFVVPDRAHATGTPKQAPALAGNNFRTTPSGAFVLPRNAAIRWSGDSRAPMPLLAKISFLRERYSY
jgi:hypothetical protein